MPSYHANEVIRTLQDILGESLAVEQQLQCEELVLNIYPGAINRWVRSWAKSLSKKEGKVLTFNHFYAPLMNGICVGAMKNPKNQLFKFDTPNKKMVYAAMHAYLGTNFSMKELEDIVWLTQFTTKEELTTAINVAQYHGATNGTAYIRAIIVGNRRKAAAQLKAHDQRFKKITEDPPDVSTGVPNVKSLQDAWTKRLKAAYDRSTEDGIERGARKKLQI